MPSNSIAFMNGDVATVNDHARPSVTEDAGHKILDAIPSMDRD